MLVVDLGAGEDDREVKKEERSRCPPRESVGGNVEELAFIDDERMGNTEREEER